MVRLGHERCSRIQTTEGYVKAGDVKRNWDTIRELLTKVEECTLPSETVRLAHFPTDREAEISYHISLLIEAGLVHGQMSQTITPGVWDFLAKRLTWDGHEFLDSIRSETVWARTKKAFLDKGVEMSFDLVKICAKEVATTLLKGALGS